jgi:hypothetical protein
MRSTFNILILLAGLFILTTVGPHARTNAQAAGTPTCVMALTTPSGGGTPSFQCLDISTALVPILQPLLSGASFGGPCTAPASGVAAYAQISPTQCIPITYIPAPGFVAGVLPRTNPAYWLGRTVTPTVDGWGVIDNYPYNSVQFPPDVPTMTFSSGR